MDTVEYLIFLNKALSEEDLQQLKCLGVIKSIRISIHGWIIEVIIPRHFFINNAYLITKQKEVNKAMSEVIESIVALGYKIEKIETLRVDYPFTCIRDPQESFNSYRQIWEWFGSASELQKWSVKDTGCKKARETYTMHDTLKLGKSRNKIVIYDQHAKMKQKLSKSLFAKTLEEYPELENRSRIEVVQRHRQVYRGSYPSLKKIKNRSYEILEEVIFSKLELAKKETIEELTRKLISSRELKANCFRLGEFIRDNKMLIYDYEILRESIKNVYKESSAKKTYKRAKKILKELEEKEGVFYIGNFKRIEEMKKQLKKENRKKV